MQISEPHDLDIARDVYKQVSLMLDSRVLCDQQLHERMKQRFASLSGVVHKLEAPPYHTWERRLCVDAISGGATMTDVVYCDLCKEQDALTPVTVACRVQREDEPDATPQSVSCRERLWGVTGVQHA
jgi:hypothetical protein